MSDQPKTGPWEGAPHTGTSGKRYYVVQRNHSKAWGGVQVLSAGFRPRRFKSLESAQKAADAENSAERARLARTDTATTAKG